MTKLKLYLDSTVFGFAANDKAGERHENAKLLLRQVGKSLFDGYISDVVLREIEAAPVNIRLRLEREIVNPIIIISETEEIKTLAENIANRGIIPATYYGTALHVATGILAGIDVLVSYNFKHLVRIDVSILVDEFTKENGLPSIRLASPDEVVIYER